MADLGHLLDADTICLYKHRDRLEPSTADNTDGIADQGGNYPMTAGGTPTPIVTWGPGGPSQRQVFARGFCNPNSGTQQLVSQVIDQALIDANRVDHSFEFLFRFDEQVGGEDYVFSIGGPASVNTSLDWLMRFSRLSSGALSLWWERFDSDERAVTTSTTLTTDGQWHVAHVTRTEDPGLAGSFFASLYIDGAFVESWGVGATAYTTGSGLIPDVTSGTADRIHIGSGGGSAFDNFFGAVGSVRMINRLLTPVEIAEASATLLSAGTIAYDAPNTVFHYQLDEAPDWIDESPNGFHIVTAGSVLGDDEYRGIDANKIFDLLNGSTCNGRAQRINNTPIEIGPYFNPVLLQNRHGVDSLHEIFTDTNGLPEWTFEAFVVHAASTAATPNGRIIQFLGATGESLATNNLLQLDWGTDSLPVYFGEEGAGVNIQPGAFSPLFDVTFGEQYQAFHLAVRMREDPNFPGQVRMDIFVNGRLRSVFDEFNASQGGTSALNRLFFFANGYDGWVQDVKLSATARTDEEIEADAARRGPQAAAPDANIVVTGVDVLAENTLLVRFSQTLVVNEALTSTDSYSVTSATGLPVTVRAVFPSGESTAQEVVLSVSSPTIGDDYELLANAAFRGLDGQTPPETIEAFPFVARKTKMDNILARMPELYATQHGTNLRSVFHAITREDDRIGGDQDEQINFVPIPVGQSSTGGDSTTGTEDNNEVSFVAGNSVFSDTGDSVTIPAPAGIQEGDLLLFTGQSEGAVLDPAGYTVISNETGSHSGGSTGHMFAYKFADSGDVAAADFTFQRSFSGNGGFAGVLMVYRGVDPDDPIQDTLTGAGARYAAAGIDFGSRSLLYERTSLQRGCMVVWSYGGGSGGSGTAGIALPDRPDPDPQGLAQSGFSVIRAAAAAQAYLFLEEQRTTVGYTAIETDQRVIFASIVLQPVPVS